MLAIDLHTQVIKSALCKLASLLEGGRVLPLQNLAYPFADVALAFRQFSRAQHMGKIVLHMPCYAHSGGGEEGSSSGSWVITGGLGSLGALTSDWLIGQGQQHLVLLGRTGR